MNLVFLTHPEFFPSVSMNRFARLLGTGLEAKGHQVSYWTPEAKYFRFSVPKLDKKWLGYVDQYVLFPQTVKERIKTCPSDTLFVLGDNALGPWLPMVASRPHVMHCHDFLAQKSALGQIAENPVSWTGRQYQQFIRKGYQTGNHFISVSNKTQVDLHEFLGRIPATSEVVYNGLSANYYPENQFHSRSYLSNKTALDLSRGYLLHVGGNQWYKNRGGVLELYNALCARCGVRLPLLMIGKKPSPALLKKWKDSPFQSRIHFLENMSDKEVRLAYSGATLFLFPSLAEGFGWPIAEAMASGCPVVTTQEAPMTEVAGEAAILIDRRPTYEADVDAWAVASAVVINKALKLSTSDRNALILKGQENVKRFSMGSYLTQIESIYQRVLAGYAA